MSQAMMPPRTAPLVNGLLGHLGRDHLPRHLDLPCAEIPWQAWHEAMYGPLDDFLTRNGKAFRANFVNMCWRMSGGFGESPPELQHIVEFIHTGSLIVDDIEDGAQSRRGAPALHRIYGIPKALNAGNWLYFWPQVMLAELDLQPNVELRLHRHIARTLSRCHHGQALDLSIRVFEWDQAEIPAMVETATRLKSGVLFELAAALGCVPAGASPDLEAAMIRFGGDLGLVLQMYDDASGILNDARTEKAQEDLIQARLTWPWAWLAAKLSPSEYHHVQAMGRAVYERNASFLELRQLMYSHLHDTMLGDPRCRLDQAFESLRPHVHSIHTLQTLREEMKRLELSYV